MINLTKLDNGILFDLSILPNAGVDRPKFVFRPSLFHTIIRVEAWSDRISYLTDEGKDFNFSYNIPITNPNSYPKLTVDGLDAVDNYDLFNKFIAKL